MSSQWEVVTKSKRSKMLEKNVPQAERKKLLENGPKLEEILPAHHVRSIFANLSKEKNKEKKTEKPKAPSPKKPKPAEPPKKQSAPPQPPKPKNIESALGTISPQELECHLENLKASFPNSELLWLKGVLGFLGSNLHIDTDPVFSGKSPQYPSLIIPKALKATLISILKSAGETNLFYFFDQLLTGLAVDMSKNQPVLGHKILLQLIGHNWPKVCCNSFAKTAILLNSYQNRNTIGLSLLWGLGQGGYKDVTVGIKVWQNIMLPLSELKNYSRYVAEYIEKILKAAEPDSKIYLTQDEFFATYNALTTPKGFPRECHKGLSESASMLIKKYIHSDVKLANIFLRLFREIEDSSQHKVQIGGCIECLITSSDCFRIWRMNYKKNTLPSTILIKKLKADWENLPSEFTSSSKLNDFLKEASQLSSEIQKGKKKDPHVGNLLELVSNIQDKATQKKKTNTKKSSSICPWFCGIFFLTAAIAGVIAYDYHSHGAVFEKCVTGKTLKNAGVLPYVETAWYKTMSTGARGYKWAEENVPVFYAKAAIVAKPYLNLSCDLYKIVRNSVCQTCETIREYFKEKSPAVSEFIEGYAPGLPQKIQDLSSSAWSTSVSAYQNSCEFFKTKIFVGSLSPENLSKAINQTQIVAAQYYSWFHEKVDAYAKIK